jgi:hypothetical protein
VVLPDLGDVEGARASHVTGSAEDICRVFRGYEQLGVSHLQLEFAPYSVAALERIGRAVGLLRQTA